MLTEIKIEAFYKRSRLDVGKVYGSSTGDAIQGVLAISHPSQHEQYARLSVFRIQIEMSIKGSTQVSAVKVTVS